MLQLSTERLAPREIDLEIHSAGTLLLTRPDLPRPTHGEIEAGGAKLVLVSGGSGPARLVLALAEHARAATTPPLA